MYPANHNSYVLLTNTQITLACDQALHIVKITRARGDTRLARVSSRGSLRSPK